MYFYRDRKGDDRKGDRFIFLVGNKSVPFLHINPNAIPSGIDRAAFYKWKVQCWQQRSADLRN